MLGLLGLLAWLAWLAELAWLGELASDAGGTFLRFVNVCQGTCLSYVLVRTL